MIKVLTDREVNSSMLPADAGCVVDNVDTVISIYMAVAKVNTAYKKDYYSYRRCGSKTAKL